MSHPILVGVALTNPDESRTVSAWLAAAEIEVETLVEACKVESNLSGRGVACLVADGALLASGYLTSVRRNDARLPVVAVVDAGAAPDAALARADVSVVTRPLDQASLVLAVSLAHGEGRQARRRVRKRSPRIPSRAGGAPAVIVDISADGVRLELTQAFAARLGPQFRLQVPMVALDVVLQRAWVASTSGGTVQCGAKLVNPNHSQTMAWERIMELTSSSVSRAERRDHNVATAVAPDLRVHGRVSQLWSAAVRVGDWASHLTRAR